VRSSIALTFWKKNEARLRREAKSDPFRPVVAVLLAAGQHWARVLVLDAKAKRQQAILTKAARAIGRRLAPDPIFAFKRGPGRPDADWKRQAREALKPAFGTRPTQRLIREIDVFVRKELQKAADTVA
jgi:hypothetical protein